MLGGVDVQQVDAGRVGAIVQRGIGVSYVAFVGVCFAVYAFIFGYDFLFAAYGDGIVGVCTSGVSIWWFYFCGDNTTAHGLVRGRIILF